MILEGFHSPELLNRTFTMATKFSLPSPMFDGEDIDAYNLWLTQFERYVRVTKPANEDKLDLFLLCAGSKAAKFYNEVTWLDLTQEEIDAGLTTYQRAVDFVTKKFAAGKNILSERIKLYSLKQKPNQSLNDFLSELRQVSKFCNFPVTFADEALRDAFCHGLLSDTTKQAVCRAFASATQKSRQFALDDAVTAAEVEEAAQQTSSSNHGVTVVAASKKGKNPVASQPARVQRTQSRRCHWCGSQTLHGKAECPARDKTCHSCNRKGHFKGVCLAQKKVAAQEGASDSDDSDFVASLSYKKRQRRFVLANVNGISRHFLVDSGSDITVVEKSVAKQLKLGVNFKPHNTRSIGDQLVKITGSATAQFSLNGHLWQDTIYVAAKLCDPAILGSSSLSQFQSVTIDYKGPAPPLVIASNPSPLEACEQNFLNLEPFPIVILQDNATPIRCPSRFRSEEDQKFIREEVQKLEKAGVIEKSQSPWRAQVVVSKTANHRKRMCIDYSTTVNPYTIPDAYPIPVIEQLILKVCPWKWFSYIDLKSAYHQLRLLDEEKPLTAFEANGDLWQFTRLPFGVTNGVAAFQKAINTVVEGLEGVAVDIDDVVVGGVT